MAKLTDKQLDILYKIVDIHFEWFKIYSSDPPKYEDVLRLNHQKLLDISASCEDCTEDKIDIIFLTILEDYTQMLEDYET